ncbi:MAG: hypothetical protein GKC03_09175 [Methanomassiliicoccales archaeon]|nr:hypothetical protein [Methanomassiliicoccales archaeon]NYT14633.1 hypothetical protein [Methanomassiliicoccales archaeon]
MNPKQIAIMAAFVVLGVALIFLAFTMLETAPYFSGTSGTLLEIASFPSFVIGAVAVSKGLPF